MALFRLAVCGTRCLGILVVAWGFLGEAAAAEPARDGSAQGRELFFREWMPGDRGATAATGSGRSTTRPPASPATTWARPGARGRRARTWRSCP